MMKRKDSRPGTSGTWQFPQSGSRPAACTRLIILPLPAREGRGEGERFEYVLTSSDLNLCRRVGRSPSPFVPLALGQGDDRPALSVSDVAVNPERAKR